MEHGIQSILKKIGDEGCYFLCLLKACGLPQSRIADAYCECLERGYIGEDCFIKDGAAILRLFGINATRLEKLDAEAALRLAGELPKVQIACYVNGRYSHFVLIEDGGLWDPLGESNTVRNGTLKSWRLYY